jgi:hypothetical protein
MRCIPEEPEFGEGQVAEEAVWEALKRSLPDDVVLAHSVQVRDGRAEHEIDILVLWPGVGMAAIEVKGGKVGVGSGQWYQSDKAGRHNIQSPVVQSQASMHAFKNWLEDQLGSRLSSRFAYLVSLPYTDVSQGWAMAGCARSLILDQADTESLKDKVRHAIEREGSGATTLTPAFLERIVRKLSGDLDAGSAQVPDPHEAEDAQDHLTVRQSVLLRATRSLPRVRFTGGAGSGKTWLALEKARPKPVPAAAGLRLAAGQAGLHRGVSRVRPGPWCPGRGWDGLLRGGDAAPPQGAGGPPGTARAAGRRRRR